MTSVGQNLRAIQDERTRQRYRAEVSGKRQYINTLQGNLTNNIQSNIYSEEPETPEFPKSVLGSAEFLQFNHGQPKRRNESYFTQQMSINSTYRQAPKSVNNITKHDNDYLSELGRSGSRSIRAQGKRESEGNQSKDSNFSPKNMQKNVSIKIL